MIDILEFIQIVSATQFLPDVFFAKTEMKKNLL